MPASEALPRVTAQLAPQGTSHEGPRVRAEQRGESVGSFEEIYDRHVDVVWRALRRFGVAESSIEDAVQEVFLVAFRKLETFEGKSAVSTWLYGIAAHVARNA